MATSLITKKKIAKAFKKQLAVKSFEKISVVDIMDQAQIRRQTFYNHFLDQYELLDWIFETELQEQVTYNLNYISGFQLLDELLFYFERNKTFYAQLFDIKGQNDFYSYFVDYCQVLMAKIISEYQSQEMSQSDDADYLAFFTRYHARALADMIKGYVSQSEPKPCLTYLKQLILTSIY
ncbi:TPA: dihydroxyacetone kinase transcriptional activator DhaS [Streptococcus pyogenes]|uniref:dihydroxyacetone kinase transcriptional activator DhaS n=1 Tax=Streptococcus pyogenes TaxID=1314 RepID=UPI00109C0962|nr:dihydroxyacetone kinase transcriptional activator DhaS [Streptococcus pyogenes]VHE52749.1 HTH-type dhaKLM operon transcriptional activator dhaS [Streptococcus pyogenes]HEP1294282.1 dihydroxyacetone kinase transcriptional activator DhaS [Streptococcus pyogenes]